MKWLGNKLSDCDDARFNVLLLPSGDNLMQYDTYKFYRLIGIQLKLSLLA